MGSIAEHDKVLAANETHPVSVECDFIRVLESTGRVRITASDGDTAVVSAGVAFRGDPLNPWRGFSIEDLSGAQNTVKVVSAAGREVDDTRLSFSTPIQVDNGASDFIVQQYQGADFAATPQLTLVAGVDTALSGLQGNTRFAWIQNVGATTVKIFGYRSLAGANNGQFDLYPGVTIPWDKYRLLYANDAVGGGILNRLEHF